MSKFNFNIDIEDDMDDNRQNSLSKSKYNSKSQMQLYLEQYIIDLGLPSKTIWCKYNLGVDINQLNKAEDWYGDYYAWGEIIPKDLNSIRNITLETYYGFDKYDFMQNYKWGTYYNGISKLTKYCNASNYGQDGFEDNLMQLLLEDDAAYQNMHLCNYKFRMPTKKQFEELIENTTSKWVENYYNINGLNGRIFKSKINAHEMFIPAAGSCNDSELYDDGIVADLWTSSLDIDDSFYAWKYMFFNNKFSINSSRRYYGLTIRPVLQTY